MISNSPSYKMLNPAVFIYSADNSILQWHKHSEEISKSQLVLNITKPGVDYSGGETLFSIKGGLKNEKQDAHDKNSICASNFNKGDLLKFPLSKWHKVNPTKKSNKEKSINCRISLILSLAIRHSSKYANEYL
jgi:hypothetical protein